ncbi:MAG TPA: hypothetical protein PLD47_03735 [Aggregatilineales bacterium]|nr:hypothetical protein [Anaerolineales bacterium]HRE46812.1 hypothetical protein [Aggregatilineales bacterium]
MNPTLDTLSVIILTAYILFSFALGIWAGANAVRGQGLDAAYFGALWFCTALGVGSLILWLLRSLAGEQLRWVYGLYMAYFIVVYPGTFALLRGRDDRTAAWIFAGIAIFTAFSAISASDPSRGVVVLPVPSPAAP